jgi:hypothetical protein
VLGLLFAYRFRDLWARRVGRLLSEEQTARLGANGKCVAVYGVDSVPSCDGVAGAKQTMHRRGLCTISFDMRGWTK